MAYKVHTVRSSTMDAPIATAVRSIPHPLPLPVKHIYGGAYGEPKWSKGLQRDPDTSHELAFLPVS